MLVTFIGGVGHFEPLVPLARAAQARGHEIAVACAGSLVGRVEAAGFTALPTSAVRTPQPRPRDRAPLAPTDARAAEVEFARNFADKGARRHATAVREHLLAWRPDVVVRDEADLGTVIATERLDVPCVSVLVLMAGMLIRPDLVGPPLAALRAEHGLPPDPDLTMLARGLVLSPFPPSFRDPASPVPLPPTTHAFRPLPVPSPPVRTGRPRVYATLGTVFNSESGDLLERLVRASAELEADVLVTTGRDVDPAELGPTGPHVRVERFVPQAEVLPGTDLVVSHGGSGSLGATLAHGLPSVLLPLGADQPHNADRAETLGLGRVCDAATATADDIARVVTEALHDDDLRATARRMAEESAALPDVEAMVPLVEAVAG